MKMTVCSIRDRGAEAFGRPFFTPAIGVAIRSFQDEVNRKAEDSQIYLHPDDFVGLQDAGDPVEVAQRYNEQGADELTFLDITATSDDRDLILPIIEAVASKVFIP